MIHMSIRNPEIDNKDTTPVIKHTDYTKSRRVLSFHLSCFNSIFGTFWASSDHWGGCVPNIKYGPVPSLTSPPVTDPHVCSLLKIANIPRYFKRWHWNWCQCLKAHASTCWKAKSPSENISLSHANPSADKTHRNPLISKRCSPTTTAGYN